MNISFNNKLSSESLQKSIPLIPFYFLRHGQTDWNVQEMWQGWTDIPLNETGYAQARSAQSVLSGQGISRIVASPLARAHTTAKIINKHLGVPLQVLEDLKECSLGVLEGTYKDKSVMSTDLTHIIAQGGGEHVDVFKARIANALCAALDPDHTTLIVAHGGVYWAIMDMLGFKEKRSHNCVPYLFTPPTTNKSSWTVKPLE